MSKTFVASIFFGALCTCLIFYFMSSLLMDNNKNLQDKTENISINFLRIYKESDLETRNRLPSKAPKPEESPKQPQLKISVPKKTSKPQLKWSAPKINQSLSFKSGATLQSRTQAIGSSEVLPLVRIEPQYPQRARVSGTEGWVELSFDVTKTGSVTNVQIIASQPWKIFDISARRAVLKWKYKARIINGKATMQKDLKTRFEFKLEGPK